MNDTLSTLELAERCLKGRVVLIDDDAAVTAALSMVIEYHGYACESYGSAVDYSIILEE